MSMQRVCRLLLAFAASSVLGCLPEISDGTGDGPQGTGCGDLIPITASTTMQGIRAENNWIAEHYPGYEDTMQALGWCGATPVDIITIEGPSGDEKTLYFDISSFFWQ